MSNFLGRRNGIPLGIVGENEFTSSPTSNPLAPAAPTFRILVMYNNNIVGPLQANTLPPGSVNYLRQG